MTCSHDPILTERAREATSPPRPAFFRNRGADVAGTRSRGGMPNRSSDTADGTVAFSAWAEPHRNRADTGRAELVVEPDPRATPDSCARLRACRAKRPGHSRAGRGHPCQRAGGRSFARPCAPRGGDGLCPVSIAASGTGKTTTALALAGAGFALAADDAAVIGSDGSARGVGMGSATRREPASANGGDAGAGCARRCPTRGPGKTK